jgi:CysZ protein
MAGILRAYTLALRSLLRPVVLAHFGWPPVVAALGWAALGYLYWDRLARGLAGLLARGHGSQPAIAVTAKVALYLMSVPFALVTAILILELVALPFILEYVARRDYPAVARRHGGSLRGSVRNTLRSSGIAAGLAVVTLPAWLIPGAGAVIAIALSSWLNYRSFRYDVLMSHADADELSALPRTHRPQLLVMALGAGLLALVPLVNLLSVPLAGLSFAHYLLDALAKARAARGTLTQPNPGLGTVAGAPSRPQPRCP